MLYTPTTAILLIALGTAGALTAYDCQHPEAAYQALDLLRPAACPDPDRDYEESRSQNVQLLQTDSKMPIKAFRCQASLSKQVTRCGYDSLTYGSLWPVWLKDQPLTPDECRKAVVAGALTIEGKVYQAEMDRTKRYRFFSQGYLDDNMLCTYVTGFESGGRWFRYSTEETLLDITLTTVRGTADTATGEVIFTNGIRANYKDLVTRDDLEGTMVWTAEEPGCEDTVSEIFHGGAALHRLRSSPSLQGSIVLLRSNDTSQFAGLVLKALTTTCGVRCFTTQVKGLIVCPYREGDEPIPKAAFKAHFEPGQVDLQTQLGYLHVTTNMAMANRFAQVQTELCQTDRRTLFNKLQAIAGAQNHYALLDLYGPGHQVYPAGAAVYVTKCIPVDVTRVDFPNCTQEVPVLHQNETWFVDPFNRILTPFPTVLPCTDLMPVRWLLNGQWFCSHPQVLPCTAPLRLNTTTTTYVPVHDFTLGMGQGVYSPEQRKQHERYVVAQMSRRPVVSKITNAATMGGSHGQLGIPLSLPELDGLSYHFVWKFFPVIYFLGEAWIYLSSSLMLLLILKIIAGATVRGFFAFRRYGCGRWVLFALWETLFVVATTPWRLISDTAEALTKELEANGLGLPDAAPGLPVQHLSLIHI